MTTQSGSCSKRTHLCHHMASRVDTALLICALVFSVCLHKPARLNKRASMFTSIEPVQICAFQTCQRRGCKNSARRMPTLKTDVTGCRGLHRERGELQQAMRVSAETARGGTGRCRCWEKHCDLWIKRRRTKTRNTAERSWFASFLVLFPCPQRLKNYS